MKFLGKTLIFIALLAGVHLQAFDDDFTPEEIQRNMQREKDKKLLEAVKKPDVDTVKLLLQSGANANCDLSSEDGHNFVRPLTTTALCMESIVQQQVGYKRDLDQKIKELMSLGGYHIDDDLARKTLRVSMSSDSAKKCVDIAKLLLDAKADPNRRARCTYVRSTDTFHEAGSRPLDVCRELVISSTKYELTSVNAMALVLIDKGADFSSLLDCPTGSISPELQKSMSKKINKEVADGLPRFSLDLTKIVSGYII